MRKASAALVIGTALMLLSTAASARVPAPVLDKVRARATQAKFDGTILIGERDGTSEASSLGPKAPPPDAVWRWASITKQLTAVIAMQEVASGKLDLDAPVVRYWTDWKAPFGKWLRIRDLLLHNSGLPQPDASPEDKDGIPAFYRSAAKSPKVSASGFCAGLARGSPPQKFEYNNCDSIVLAEVLARVTGKSFEQLLHERLAKPLGMTSFGMFEVNLPPAKHVQPTGEFSDKDRLLNLGVYGASGGAYGTIGDLWKFDHALMGKQLLTADLKEKMWASSRDNGYYGFFQWIYPAALKGCSKPVRIVERQGLVGGIELRNFIMPESGRALIMFSRHRPTNLGDPWEGKGFAYDLLSAVVCR
ncbi:hypothetical protein GCM10022276_20150 [Sphingomonas limnosediminicola]|uniref:Beta-lactamase-related domain-containing protein n=1 Tax=Sphingomonas limnosediminicola TaxID=940133 RepID=A0ABP7LKP6_9SPHN